MSVVSKPGQETAVTPARSSRRWLTIIALVFAFGAGVVVGFGAALNTLHDQRLKIFRHPEKARDEFAAQLRTKLDLTPEQDEKITAIIIDRHDKFEDFRCDVHPRIVAIFDGMEADIAAELRPDQLAVYQQIIEERHSMFPPPPVRPKKK